MKENVDAFGLKENEDLGGGGGGGAGADSAWSSQLSAMVALTIPAGSVPSEHLGLLQADVATCGRGVNGPARFHNVQAPTLCLIHGPSCDLL